VYRVNLPDHIDEAAFQGVEVRAVIHCACTTTGSDHKAAQATSLIGARRLRKLAQQHAATQFIFISSMSAHKAARSTYGMTKWQLEQEMTAPSDAIVKPGMIIGPGGIFGRTLEIVRKLPIVPVPYSGCHLQTIWIKDASAGIVEIVRRKVTGRVILAHPETISMWDFYRKIVDIESPGKTIIPISGDLTLCAIMLLERLGLRLPVSSESLLGIKYRYRFDPLCDLQRLGLEPLNFQQSLARFMERSAA
jgi:nucleoside-diphosphate-sugar epimerase